MCLHWLPVARVALWYRPWGEAWGGCAAVPLLPVIIQQLAQVAAEVSQRVVEVQHVV